MVFRLSENLRAAMGPGGGVKEGLMNRQVYVLGRALPVPAAHAAPILRLWQGRVLIRFHTQHLHKDENGLIPYVYSYLYYH